MGKVSAIIEIKPTGDEVDLDELLEKAKEELTKGSIEDHRTEPMAFGISKLVVQVLIPDDAGGADEVATRFEDIEGVQSVDVESVSRL